MTRDFEQCGILTGEDTDKSVQPHGKLRRILAGFISLIMNGTVTVLKFVSMSMQGSTPTL